MDTFYLVQKRRDAPLVEQKKWVVQKRKDSSDAQCLDQDVNVFRVVTTQPSSADVTTPSPDSTAATSVKRQKSVDNLHTVSASANVAARTTPATIYYQLCHIPVALFLTSSFVGMPPHPHRTGHCRRYSDITFDPVTGRAGRIASQALSSHPSGEPGCSSHTPSNAEIDDDTLRSPALLSLLAHFSNMVLRHDEERRVLLDTCGTLGCIGVEQTRTFASSMAGLSQDQQLVANSQAFGIPCPEGVHQNGVDWIMTVCVARRNVDGGVSSLHYTSSGEPFIQMRQDAGTALFLNDRAIFHYVSPIWASDEGQEGARDVITFSMKPLQGSSTLAASQG